MLYCRNGWGTRSHRMGGSNEDFLGRVCRRCRHRAAKWKFWPNEWDWLPSQYLRLSHWDGDHAKVSTCNEPINFSNFHCVRGTNECSEKGQLCSRWYFIAIFWTQVQMFIQDSMHARIQITISTRRILFNWTLSVLERIFCIFWRCTLSQEEVTRICKEQGL